MEKNIYIKREVSTSNSMQNMLNSITNKVKSPIILLAKYYSTVLERKISIRQTLLLLNAQIAFVFAVAPSRNDNALLFIVLVRAFIDSQFCKRPS